MREIVPSYSAGQVSELITQAGSSSLQGLTEEQRTLVLDAILDASTNTLVKEM